MGLILVGLAWCMRGSREVLVLRIIMALFGIIALMLGAMGAARVFRARRVWASR